MTQAIVGGLTGAVSGFLRGGVQGALMYGAIGLAGGFLQARLQPKNNARKAPGITINQRGAALPRQVIYGKTKVGGVIVFDDSHGGDNKYLSRIIAYADHEVESIETVFLDDYKLTLSGDSVTSAVKVDASGNEISGTQTNRFNSYVKIRKVTGGHTASLNGTFTGFSSTWTTSHKLLGITHLAIRFEFKDKVTETHASSNDNGNEVSVYEGGLPEVTAIIKGKKVYDPRNSTTAWSDNPALIIRDYLLNSTYGLGEATDNVYSGTISDAVSFAKAADVCDETFADDDSVTVTRYTANGVFTTEQAPVDILNQILTSCAGSLWYAQGKWRFRAGKYVAPTLTLDEDDLRSPMTVSTRHSRRENFNKVRGTFRGAETNYQFTDYPAVTASAFVTEDGGSDFEQTVDFPLSFTDTSKEARRLANIMLERMRDQITVTADFGLAAFNLQPSDIVKLNNTRFGFADGSPATNLFEVASWGFYMDELEPKVTLTLREINTGVYDEITDVAVFSLNNTSLPGALGATAQFTSPINDTSGVHVIQLDSGDSLPTDSSGADTFFTDKVDLNAASGAQAWFIDENNNQNGWVYDGTNWNEATSGAVNGDFIAPGTIDAGRLNINNLSAITADLGAVKINELLILDDNSQGFIGGRDARSDYTQEGFFIGRHERPGDAVGFEVSHTSNIDTTGDGSIDTISGIIHEDGEKLQLINPELKVKDSGVSTQGFDFYSASGTRQQLTTVSRRQLTIVGGGGGGAGGSGDATWNQYGTAGDPLLVEFWTASTGGTKVHSLEASGGARGEKGSLAANGGNGAASALGSGGLGGNVDTNSSRNGQAATSTHYGAGGGGGQGDSADGGFFGVGADDAGFSGTGGGAGGTKAVWIVYDSSASSPSYNSSTNEITVGSGGVYLKVGDGSNKDGDGGAGGAALNGTQSNDFGSTGGAGANGVAYIDKALDSLQTVTIPYVYYEVDETDTFTSSEMKSTTETLRSIEVTLPSGWPAGYYIGAAEADAGSGLNSNDTWATRQVAVRRNNNGTVTDAAFQTSNFEQAFLQGQATFSHLDTFVINYSIYLQAGDKIRFVIERTTVSRPGQMDIKSVLHGPYTKLT